MGHHDRPPPTQGHELSGVTPGVTVISDSVARRGQLLEELTDLLGGDLTPEQVVDGVLRQSIPVIGAQAGAVFTVSPDAAQLARLGYVGYSDDLMPGDGRLELGWPSPVTDSARDGQPRFLDLAALRAQYPRSPDARLNAGSLAALPLRVGGRLVGVLGLSFAPDRPFDPPERSFLRTLAGVCAQALDRAVLLRAERAARAQAAFLMEASRALSESLDVNTTLESVARLVVPRFADWCAVLLPHEGALRVAQVAHRDPARARLLQGALESGADFGSVRGGAAESYHSGRTVHHEKLTPELVATLGLDGPHAALLLELGLRSFLAVALVAHGRPVGVLTFALAESARHFTADDVSLAEELARRAGAALDNARLYQHTRLSERRFRSLIEATTQIAWSRALNGEVVEEQAGWAAFTGQALPEYLGWGWLNAVHPDDRERTRAAWKRAYETQGSYRVEQRLRRSDGQYRTMQVRATLLRNDDGSPREWIGVHEDVTERREAEQQLREREARYRALVEHAEVGVARITPGGRFIEINPAGAALLGRSREELLTLSVADVTHPDDLHDAAEVLQHILIGKGLRATLENRYLRPDGTVVWARSSLSAVRAEGRVSYLVAVLVDMTERRRSEARVRELNVHLEERVQERTRELQEANEELEAFAYSVSHDLRTPVRHIAGFTSLLQRLLGETPDPRAVHYLTVVEGAAARMNNLIDAMLHLSRTSRQPLRLAPVDLGRLVEQVRQEVEPDRLGREVRWEVTALPRVMADYDTLHQVMTNLISNALKYTREQPVTRIRVRAEEREDEWVVLVEDNGVGFDPRYTDKLFGVFQRLHRHDEFEGIGVGLANVRRIIARHGGRVWAQGDLGRGATFAFSLPRQSLPPLDAPAGDGGSCV